MDLAGLGMLPAKILYMGKVSPKHQNINAMTPLKFNTSPLKNRGWKTTFLLGLGNFCKGYIKIWKGKGLFTRLEKMVTGLETSSEIWISNLTIL